MTGNFGKEATCRCAFTRKCTTLFKLDPDTRELTPLLRPEVSIPFVCLLSAILGNLKIAAVVRSGGRQTRRDITAYEDSPKDKHPFRLP